MLHRQIPTQRELTERAYAQSSAPHLLAERAQLLRINPVPYALHVVPVRHDAVFHGVLDLQQTPEFLRFPAYENVPLEGARHDADVLRPPDAGDGDGGGEERAVKRPRTRPDKGDRTYYEGKKHFGWSWPANPALMVPEP